MNFEEINKQLPNGFHDGKLKTISINYLSKTISLEIDFWIGNEKKSEQYRSARLTISEFDYCIMDAPMESYPFNSREALTIDAGPGFPETSPIKAPAAKKSSFQFWIFVNEWNGFIRISAKTIELNW